MRLFASIIFLFIVSIPQLSHSQILCSPMGSSTFCAGYDSQMNDRAYTLTPLGPSTIITESGPLTTDGTRPSATDRMSFIPSLMEPRRTPSCSLERRMESMDLGAELELPGLEPLDE